VPDTFVRFELNLELLDRIFTKVPDIKPVKIRSVGATLMHAVRRTDGRMDMKLIGAFRNYANAPKKRLR